jgi:DNA-binding beta-propeller fold protein YncE
MGMCRQYQQFLKGKKMKVNYRELKRALTTAITLLLFLTVLAHADTIYVSCGNLHEKYYGYGTIEKFDSSGNGSVLASGLYNPMGLAFDSSGNLYAANFGSSSGTIDRFSPSGTYLGTFYSTASDMPSGLAIDSSDNLYVTEHSVIEKISPSGTDLGTFASAPGSYWPVGLAFDSSGNLYMTRPSYIVRFSPSGDELGTFASFPDSYWPVGLAFDSSGNLYAACYNSGTIEKFDSSGNGSVFASGLHGPVGLAFDSNGNLYAACYNSGTIEKFDSSGNRSLFASGLGSPGYITVIPEPATLLLLTLGAVILRKPKK